MKLPSYSENQTLPIVSSSGIGGFSLKTRTAEKV
jgi:hypothetical protein